MLAVRYAAVVARGCSSAVVAAVAATTSTAAGSVAAASTGTGASAGTARAKSASCGYSRLIAPTNGFLSHRLASLTLPLFSFSSLPFCSVAIARFFRTGCSRDGRVCYAHDGRAFREESSRPTDRPSDNGCGSAGG